MSQARSTCHRRKSVSFCSQPPFTIDRKWCNDLSFSRIQFTPDLMPMDITGTDILQETGDRRREMARRATRREREEYHDNREI